MAATPELCRNGHDIAVLGRRKPEGPNLTGKCVACCRERDRKRVRPADYKQKKADSKRRWKKTESGRASVLRYRHSELSRAAQARYNATDKGRRTRRRSSAKYANTVNGQLVIAQRTVTQRIAMKEARIAELERMLNAS